ncbi:PPE domain-containing protein [Nocardia sp. GCM10030253]|uniref:PPE domain-containing protein n=1 Tax=Nocardia sp. GCM10030253 TaxID=3273404 RepID=UPI00363B46AE
MALDVDVRQLVIEATKLAEMARDMGMALPRSWVVPAGSDQISAQHVPDLNATWAELTNGVRGLLNDVQRSAHKIGEAAAEYSAQDDRGARRVGGRGGELVTNPVGEVQEFAPQQPPKLSFPTGGGSVDPLTFAEQLRAGPGPGSAAKFADSVRAFAGGPFAAALGFVDGAARMMESWRPVGTKAAAELDRSRGKLTQLGTGMQKLAADADTYSNAFRNAKAKHPTPEEIKAARKELVAAIRSKNQLAIQKALAKFEELNARSAETATKYVAEVEAKAPEDDGSGGNGNGNNGGGDNSGSGGDSSALSSMLPALMSAMSGLGQNAQDPAESFDDLGDYGYDDYGDLGIPSGLGGGGGGGGGMPGVAGAIDAPQIKTFAASALPAISGNLAGGAAMPRAGVIDPLSTAASGAARGAAGAPMMPYMPMAPGMGGGGAGNNNDRNRVVAWHPDRLMYVDDTPHTEAVIGERPTIAPTVTPPTPGAGNQNSSQPGGNA